MPGKKKIYWDANIFLAWIKDEQQWGTVIMGGIEDTVHKVHQNEIVLFTSTMTQSEIYESRLNHKAKEMLEGLFKRRNVKLISVDQRIGSLSGFIRDYYHRKKIKIKTPDAIHLATGIIYEANEFHTLDGAGPTKKASDLLRLGTKIAGRYNLLICTPAGEPPPLTAGIPTIKIEGSKDIVKLSTKPVIPNKAEAASQERKPVKLDDSKSSTVE